MGKGKSYKPGQVVWVPNVPDRNGNAKEEARPLLVIEPRPTSRESSICCLCISTDPKDDADDPAVVMPWDATHGSTTGLFKWCRVVLLWFVLVDQAQVLESTGAVDPAFLDRILAEREQALLAKMARKGK